MGFAQHQSFHIRDGWLRKGMIEIAQNEAIFTDSNAYLKFGLGKNMVEALRFWMPATGLSKEETRLSDRKHVQKLTPFGQAVLQNDPYLEDDGTLWLVHYHLLKNPQGATSWYWFFNHFARLDFDREQFVKELSLWNALRGAKDIVKSSLEKDFECLVKTYQPRELNASPEDTIECPLVHLKLMSLEVIQGCRRYHLNRPEPRTIPPLVLLYVLKKWQEEYREGALQVSLREILSSPCSPGRTFLLGMRLAEAIRRANEAVPNFAFRFTRTAGLDVLTVPNVQSDEILEQQFAMSLTV